MANQRDESRKREAEYKTTLQRLQQQFGRGFRKHVERTCTTRADRVERGYMKAQDRGGRNTPYGANPAEVILVKCVREFAQSKGLAGTKPKRRRRR